MLTNTAAGKHVAWHFDSRLFDYQGEGWEITGSRIGKDRNLDSTVHTIKRTADGFNREITHGDLVKMLLDERKFNEQKVLTKKTEVV